MLSRIEIHNFRGFRQLMIADLARVNLIAGRNNSGKTALLEALFLLLSPMRPELATSFSHRGESRGSVALPPYMRYGDEWRTLFFGLDPANAIRLRGIDQHDRSVDVEMALRETAEQVIEPPRQAPNDSEESIGGLPQEIPVELVYHYRSSAEPSGREAIATPSGIGTVDSPREKLTVRRVPASPPIPQSAVFLNTATQPRARIAEQFSRARDRGGSTPVEDIIRKLDPRIKKLEIRVAALGPELAADVGVGQLVPLRMMGEGVARVVEIVLSIFNRAGGAILIDEIENGVHYSAMPDVWRAVMDAARGAQAQVFAATHSFECIRAAHLAASNSAEYDLRLHRLDRVHGDIRATTLDRDAIMTAMEMGTEVR